MRSVDRAALERTGLPSLVLMENAGRGIAEVIWQRSRDRAGWPALTVAIVCGAGNNGGDGFVVARHLALLGDGLLQTRVLMAAPADKLTGDAATMYRALQGVADVTVGDMSTIGDQSSWQSALLGADIIVDAIFGTGLRADVGGAPAAAIAAINATTPAMIFAVDIPSGLDGDSGRPRGVAVHADVTVTVGTRKIGLVIDPEASTGDIEVVGFGVPIVPDPALGPFCFWTDESTVRALLPPRKGGAHKGTNGHLIVVAGSPGKTGAAVLASRAALRVGAGVVTIASTATGCLALDAKVIEAMTLAFSDTDDADAGSYERVAELCAGPNVRAVALGPGIPPGPGMQDMVQRLTRELPLPLVIDADGLNLLGVHAAEILEAARGPRVITPHPGEMGRLCGRSTAEVQSDRLNSARQFAVSSRTVVVLKGARTLMVAPDGTAFMNPAVEPALATAGSGDVLTGALGGLLAQGLDPLAAARAAVFLHGRAGSRVAGLYGPTGVVAGDLPEAIAAVRASWSVASIDKR
ncbi:MAG: NAD(P)H-hydrate dehydratase [Deltaproteobacteria bacterium]|nr:NAD(P)H-hydrate dehydratase [Deltaproteobacteria bacterium]